MAAADALFQRFVTQLSFAYSAELTRLPRYNSIVRRMVGAVLLHAASPEVAITPVFFYDASTDKTVIDASVATKEDSGGSPSPPDGNDFVETTTYDMTVERLALGSKLSEAFGASRVEYDRRRKDDDSISPWWVSAPTMLTVFVEAAACECWAHWLRVRMRNTSEDEEEEDDAEQVVMKTCAENYEEHLREYSGSS